MAPVALRVREARAGGLGGEGWSDHAESVAGAEVVPAGDLGGHGLPVRAGYPSFAGGGVAGEEEGVWDADG